MQMLVRLHDATILRLARALDGWFLPSFARFVFAAVLLVYFWNSGFTKLGDGIVGLFILSDGAYVQIFPKTMEAVGYDSSQLGLFHRLVALAGTWSEFLLPALLVLGLFTRLAALGMAVFTLVQSWVDVHGHGVGGADLGGWFDAASGALIMDQRLLWTLLFAVLFVQGAGPLSLDRLLARRAGY